VLDLGDVLQADFVCHGGIAFLGFEDVKVLAQDVECQFGVRRVSGKRLREVLRNDQMLFFYRQVLVVHRVLIHPRD